jgi:hypothetical protein
MIKSMSVSKRGENYVYVKRENPTACLLASGREKDLDRRGRISER